MTINKTSRGFTLIELMTVIFIISTIATVILPHFRLAIDRARLTACQSNLRNIATAIESYYLENKAYPQNLNILIAGKYLNTIPTCPQAQADTYTAGYEYDDTSKTFTIACGGKNHTQLGFGANEPYFSESRGLGP